MICKVLWIILKAKVRTQSRLHQRDIYAHLCNAPALISWWAWWYNVHTNCLNAQCRHYMYMYVFLLHAHKYMYSYNHYVRHTCTYTILSLSHTYTRTHVHTHTHSSCTSTLLHVVHTHITHTYKIQKSVLLHGNNQSLIDSQLGIILLSWWRR